MWARVCVRACVRREGMGVCLWACSLTYAACNTHAPYWHLRPLSLHHIFPHYLTNGTVFRKKVTENGRSVLIFSTNFIWQISHSKKNSARYCHKCENAFMYNTRYSFSDFNGTSILILDFHRGMNTYSWFWGLCTTCKINFPTTFREPPWVPKRRRKIYLTHRAKSPKPRIELQFSRQIFEKSSNVKFYQNSSSGSQDVPRGRTDMKQFCERA